MSIPSAKSRTFSTNSVFSAFSLAVIGWGLLHVWGLSLNVGTLFHMLVAVPGLVLCSMVLYRYRQHWPLKATGIALSNTPDLKLSWDYRAVAFYLLLIGMGFGIALFIRLGSAFLLSLAALAMVLFPWAKISICRDHFYFSSALVDASALLGIVALGRPVHPLHYPIAAWLLLTVACMLIISVIVIHGNRREQMPVSGY